MAHSCRKGERHMTMAELYAAPEKLDGGAAMVETIKAEVGKLNGESKEQ